MKFGDFSIRIAILLVITPLISFSQAGSQAGSRAGQSDARRRFNLLTPKQEIEIGRQSAVAVEKRLPLLSDAGVNEYIKRLGQGLVARAPGERYPYSFKIANVSGINAFAFPGGPIYITRGVIAAARSEGELAGALAHEIAHVALRHGACQASNAYLAQAGLGAMGGFAGGDATTNIVAAVGGAGFNVVFLKYSREAEAEAAALGAQILMRAGYDPREMTAFFQALGRGERAEASQLRTFLDDHPNNWADWAEDRVARVSGRPRAPQISSGDFQRIQTRIAELPAAYADASIVRRAPTVIEEAPNRAAQNISVERPSSHLQDFWLHGGLWVQITYPENWMARPSGDDLGVTFIPPDGVAETRGPSRLVSGAIISRYRPIGDNSLWTGLQPRSFRYIGGRGELVEATNDLLDSALQNNPHLDFTRGSDRRGSVDGEQVITLTLVGRSPVTGRGERAQLYTRELEDGDIVYAIFIAPDDEYDNFRPVFDRMLRGLKINDRDLRRDK
ncbi:MAG: M48 family metalloprotease [Blastocatellia bacterium]|nr:M48 family metalloprotease [Blastocatellia bacterium]